MKRLSLLTASLAVAASIVIPAAAVAGSSTATSADGCVSLMAGAQKHPCQS